MGPSLLIAAVSVAVLTMLYKINRWHTFRKKISKYLDFKLFYSRPDIIGTSSDEKRRFMRISNQVSLAAGAIAGTLLLLWWLINSF